MAGPCPSGHHLDPCPYGQAECQEGDGGHQLMRPMSRRWTSPPGILRHKHVRLENIALVPASELSSLAKWQERARSLPAGDTLLVVPRNNPRLQEVGRRICQSLSAQGLSLIHI